MTIEKELLDLKKELLTLSEEELRNRILSAFNTLSIVGIVSNNQFMNSQENLIRYSIRVKNNLKGIDTPKD